MYSECWPAKRGNTSLEESPSAPWQRKQDPEIIFLALASSACAHDEEQKLIDAIAAARTLTKETSFMFVNYAKVSAQMLRAQAMA